MFLRPAAVLAALCATTIAATPDRPVLKGPSLSAMLAPGSPVRAKLIATLQSSVGTTTDEYRPDPVDFPAPVLAIVEAAPPPGPAPKPQPSDAAKCAAGTAIPAIGRIKGELTSQGYMVIEGRCFGPTSGSVIVNGFPFTPRVTIESWTPTAITVQFPKIAGVPDLIMQVAVSHAPPASGNSLGSFSQQLANQLGTTSTPVPAKFTAAIGDPIPLPSRYIAMNACAGATPICLASPPATAIALHVDTAFAAGADIWTFTMPEHWHLHAVRLVHLSRSAASSSTINGNGAQKTVRVAWSESPIEEHADATSSCDPSRIASLGALEGPIMQQICAANPVVGVVYAANYRIEPMVRGPLGMAP